MQHPLSRTAEAQRSFLQPGLRTIPIHRTVHVLKTVNCTDRQSRLYEVDDQFSGEGGAPFDFSSTEVSFPVSAPGQKPDLSLFISQPVYSASGFDLLSILSRVATRPNPRVVLGPVDLTCSFVVVDLRRYDHPIVYCSPSFCSLTGYSEEEVIGKNCRFLQAPAGQVSKGDIRRFTSQDAVAHLAKSSMADKECQTSIVNYKKNGDAFVNLVTIIPVPGGVAGNFDEQGEIVFQIGFQVDLSEQPNAILEKLRDGSYVVDYASPSSQHHQHSRPALPRERKVNTISPVVVSKELKRLLADPALLRSLPLTTSTTLQSSASVSSLEDPSITQFLYLLLLEASPDFIHVVSLKGSFLYVAPSVRRVLGYEPDEMVGTCIADYAHPEDVVPLMRELKESSATGLTSAQPTPSLPDPTNSHTASSFPAAPGSPRSVDLLFRAKTKMGRYVWVECRGRLHVEPGKGRKAIILSGRAREMMNLKWEHVDSAGGLAMAVSAPSMIKKAEAGVQATDGEDGEKGPWSYQDQEFWGMLGGMDKDSARFLSVGKGVQDVLGWSGEELLGKGLAGIVEESCQDVLGEGVGELRRYQKSYYARYGGGSYDDTTNFVDPRVRKVRCRLSTKCGSGVDVWFILYRADPDLRGQTECVHGMGGMGVSPAPLVYQIRRVDAPVVKCGPGMVDVLTSLTPLPLSTSLLAPSNQDIFQELDISRGSSWQYELQQLRYANIRLKEELKMLEVAQEAQESAETEAEAVGGLASEKEYVGMGMGLEVERQEQQHAIMEQSSIHHLHSQIRQHQHPMQYSLPMPPPPLPLPVLAPQPQVQMQTPDHLLDQLLSSKQQQYFRLNNQEPPARSSVNKRLMARSARIGTSSRGGMRIQPQQQALQCLPQTRVDWRAIPTVPPPPPFSSLASVHRHQHQHQHQHYYNQSLDQSQGQRLKRSWNVMESA
jgi:PAS domain-containing protein